MNGRNVIGIVLFFCSALWMELGSADLQDMIQGMSNDEIQDLMKELNKQEEDYDRYDLGGQPQYEDYYDEPENLIVNPSLDHKLDSRADSKSLKQSGNSQPQQQQQPPVGRGSNSVLPAYCDPPNPCPVGYDSNDGCIDDFENSSEFSREYQSTQNCLCDSEHMFNCPEDNVPQEINESPFLAHIPGLTDDLDNKNPYLAGQKLPIAAKKGMVF